MSTPETITTHTSGPRLNFKVNMFQVGTVWPVKFGKYEFKITTVELGNKELLGRPKIVP